MEFTFIPNNRDSCTSVVEGRREGARRGGTVALRRKSGAHTYHAKFMSCPHVRNLIRRGRD